MKKVLPLLIVIGLFLIGYFSTSIIINKNRKEYKKNNSSIEPIIITTYSKVKGNKIAVVKIACETDFVANNDNFKSSCMSILDKILESGSDNKDSYTDELVKASSITKEKPPIKVVFFY